MRLASINSKGRMRLKLLISKYSWRRRIVTELDALQTEVDSLKRLQAETAAERDVLLPAILDRAFEGNCKLSHASPTESDLTAKIVEWDRQRATVSAGREAAGLPAQTGLCRASQEAGRGGCRSLQAGQGFQGADLRHKCCARE